MKRKPSPPSSRRTKGRGGQASEPLGEKASGRHRPYRSDDGPVQATIAHPRRAKRDPGRSSREATRRGGQPGNHNALKHGFYSSVFKASERRLLDQIPLTDLSAEIELIRVTNKRFLEALVASKGDLDFDTQLTALRAVNLSAHSIATLLRAHALTAAIKRVADETLAALDERTPAEAPFAKP